MKKKIFIPILTLSTSATALMPLASCNNMDKITQLMLEEFCGSEFIGKKEGCFVEGITNFSRETDTDYKESFNNYLTTRITNLSDNKVRLSGTNDSGTVWYDVPASSGCENWPGIILQGHTDMIWVTDPKQEKPTNPIPVLDNEGDRKIIHTKDYKSSLGADNGVGIAASLAIIANLDNFNHGPIRFVFTADEEDTMAGAQSIANTEFFKGYTYLLNLDTENKNQVYRSCLGVNSSKYMYEYDKSSEQASNSFYCLKIDGLHGGHSGLEIMNHYANADRLAMEYLNRLIEQYPSTANIQICEFGHEGDAKKNAIANECFVYFRSDIELADLRTQLFNMKTLWASLYPGDDWTTADKIHLDIDYAKVEAKPFIGTKNSESFIKFVGSQSLTTEISSITGLMYGVIESEVDLPLLSNNVGPIEIYLDGNKIKVSIECMIRGSTRDKMLGLNAAYIKTAPSGYIGEPTYELNIPWEYRNETKVTKYIDYLVNASKNSGRGDAVAFDDIGCVEPSYWYDKIICGAIGFDITHPHTVKETLYLDTLKSGYDTILNILSKINQLGK